LTSIQSVNSHPSTINSFAYTYNSANQRTRLGREDGTFWIYKYDSLGQVISGKKYWSDFTPVAGQQFEYGFDDIGNRTSTKAGGDENGANLRFAGYYANNLNQNTVHGVPGAFDVIGVGFATNEVTVNGDSTYRHGEYFRKEITVDNGLAPVWQPVTVASPGQASVTGNEFVPKYSEFLYYDLDGNLTNDGRWTYYWDAENRLVKMAAHTSVGPQISLAFEYDSKSRRIRKKVFSDTGWTTCTNDLQFVYDGWNLIAELSNSHSALRTYTWGLDLSGSIQGAGGVGGLVGVSDSASGFHFATFDGNGNISSLVKASDGSLSAGYEYGPFGEVIRATGFLAKENPLRFSSKYHDVQTELLCFGYRFYHAKLGQWISRDPLSEKGGFNLYGFIQNNPSTLIDYLGLCCNVERFQLLFPRWRGPWPDPGSPPAYASTLDVDFILTLTPGSDPKDCRITQYMRGLLRTRQLTERHDSWTLDVNSRSGYWWDGSQWYAAHGQWFGLVAIFRDSPGFVGILPDAFPIHWGGTHNFFEFWDFRTVVEDASQGAGAGPRPRAEIPWGIFMDANDPWSLFRTYYVQPTIYW